MSKLFRYEDCHSSGVRLVEFEVFKTTPQGFWIWDATKKWVSSNGRKRFAYPTKEEALQSYIARKSRQVKILETQLGLAKARLASAMDFQSGKSQEIFVPMPRASSFDDLFY